MLTSDVPEPRTVLSETSTHPPSVQSDGMTETQRKIFYRLLVDLFVDNPTRKRSQAIKGSDNNESISTSA